MDFPSDIFVWHHHKAVMLFKIYRIKSQNQLNQR